MYENSVDAALKDRSGCPSLPSPKGEEEPFILPFRGGSEARLRGLNPDIESVQVANIPNFRTLSKDRKHEILREFDRRSLRSD